MHQTQIVAALREGLCENRCRAMDEMAGCICAAAANEILRDHTDKATAWDKLAEKNDVIASLRAKLDQIAAVCRDNAGASCDKGMALDFVRQVAESAQSANKS